MSLTDRATQPVGVTPVTVGRRDEAAPAPAPRPAANAAPVPTPSIDIPESYDKVAELVQSECPLVFDDLGKTGLTIVGRLRRKRDE